MDKSAKVEAAPAIVAPAKVAKKGKRDAEVAMEKNVSSKKQKRDVEAEQAALKKNVEAKTQKKAKTQKNVFSKTRKKPIKKQAFSSSDDDSSESDDEPKNAEGKTNVPTKKVPVAAAKQADSSSDDSESDDSSSDEDEKKAAPVKNGVPYEEDAKKVSASVGSAVSTQKKDESTDDSDESSDDDVPAAAEKQNTKSAKDDSNSDEEYPKKVSTKVSKKDSESDEDVSSEEEEGTDEEVAKPATTPKKSGGDVEMVDAEADGNSTKKAPQTAATAQAEGALKTFLVRLPFQVDRDHVVEFFKDAGEVVDVHFHVEFATEEAAQKAAKLNELELLGRAARLHWARERAAETPQYSGRGKSIFIRGFDKSGGEDEIRSALQEHFDSCGGIVRCDVLRENHNGKILGHAFIDFSDRGACAKALELNMSQLGGYTLRVREAYPRHRGWWLRPPNSGWQQSQGKKTIFDQED